MLTSRRQGGTDAALKSSLNDLDRLLSRLEQNVLSERADPELRHSVYLRRKTGANIEYARTLLLRLEQDASTVKIASQRQTLTSNLAIKRELIKTLNRHLIELDQLDTASSSEDDEPEPTPKVQGTTPDTPPQQYAPTPSTQPAELRSRRPQGAATDTAATTALFSGRKEAPPSSLQTREDQLQSAAQEQEAIKASLLSLAGQLKASNLSFSQSLEEEKDVLNRAVSGLDKNAMGLESAERKMGTLRKMTEGQGWWGRIKLYALIAAMWLAAFLLVFLAPKLRF